MPRCNIVLNKKRSSQGTFMNKKLLSVSLLALSFQAFADEPIDPLHFLTSNWSVEARDDSVVTEFGGLRYGFRQSDLTSDPPAADHVLAGNDCGVGTSVRTLTPFLVPLMVTNGGCETESTLPVLTDNGFSVVLPGGEFPPFSIQDTVLPVNLSVLDYHFNAFSTSMGASGLEAATFGFERQGFTQSFFAQRSENAQISDLAGDWAFTQEKRSANPLRFDTTRFPQTEDFVECIPLLEVRP